MAAMKTKQTIISKPFWQRSPNECHQLQLWNQNWSAHKPTKAWKSGHLWAANNLKSNTENACQLSSTCFEDETYVKQKFKSHEYNQGKTII